MRSLRNDSGCAVEIFIPVIKAFVLIFVAEFGDKSQLVCMTLASRYRAWPVLLGAILAFSFLNLLGVTVGVAVAQWLPEWMLLLLVCVLFGLFGLQALFSEDEESDVGPAKVGKHLIISVVILLFLAELGDKTQLAIAGLAGIEPPLGVWIGGTLALVLTSALGVWAGRAILSKFPVRYVHRGSGVMFMVFACVAAYELIRLQV